MEKLPDPYFFPGLSPEVKRKIMYRTCFDMGELKIVAQAVCKQQHIDLDDFRGRLKTAELADARKIFFHLCTKRLYKCTRKRLGAYMGKDQSTVTAGMQRCEELLDVDPDFRSQYYRCWKEATQQLNSYGYTFNDSTRQTKTNYGSKYERVSSLPY
jgi:hypothetical protein